MHPPGHPMAQLQRAMRAEPSHLPWQGKVSDAQLMSVAKIWKEQRSPFLSPFHLPADPGEMNRVGFAPHTDASSTSPERS